MTLPPSVEIARMRWMIAQELDLYTYPEQDADANLLIWALGRLPE